MPDWQVDQEIAPMSFLRSVAAVPIRALACDFLALLLAAAICLVPLQHVYAGLPDQLCLASGSGLSNAACIANDVRILAISKVGSPGVCEPGVSVLADVEITMESAVDRYDIGLWINQTGASARSDVSAHCFRDALIPVADPPSACNHAAADANELAYFDQDGDACGDVHASNTNPCGTASLLPCTSGGGTCLLTRRFAQLEITCSDSDEDGVVDTGACASWDTSDATTCNGVLDAEPSIGSRCWCSDNVAIVGLRLSTSLDGIFLNGFESPDP